MNEQQINHNPMNDGTEGHGIRFRPIAPAEEAVEAATEGQEIKHPIGIVDEATEAHGLRFRPVAPAEEAADDQAVEGHPFKRH